MPGSFKVWGKEYSLAEDLTMGEMCDAEDEFGVEFGNAKRSGVRMAAALMWIAIRRVDPSVSVTDIRSLPMEVFEGIAVDEDDAGPPSQTPENSNSSGDRSSLNGENPDENLVSIGDLG